ncbi:TonB-dependent receptor [Chryseotalea sanaruensis]|uniref:TonB-dependent receptor n=1 Tax=Chryseotalea sanaruensis TaxID=2482724 RepID=A0A401U8J6_9BACT|nr:TonB-dependent receptor [Chryseotalea sanaruensis]GCC51210.1 TonB-dependent receptor [Chryseotalea sanaruensis]
MKVPILLFLLLLPAFGSSQQLCTYTLTGRIIDNDSTSLPGATILITELQNGMASDGNGNFSFLNLCEGTYTIEVTFIGYKRKSQKVRLKKSEVILIKLEPDETVLGEVVVQEHYDHISKSQTSVALSGAQLESLRGKSLGAALKNITGVNTIQSGPAIFKPVIHGVHSQRILILNNGIRHEGQQWGAEHAPEIDPFLASNIVVIKDASAIKYGTDALGGVVIVNPSALPVVPGVGGAFHSVWQSNGRSGTAAGIIEGASKKIKGLNWRTHGSIKKSGDYNAPEYQLTNTGFSENNFSAALGYHKNEAAGYEIFYSRFSSELGILRGASVSSIEDLRNAFESPRPQYTDNFSYSIQSPRQQVLHNLLKANAHFHKNHNTLSIQYAFQQNDRKEFDLRRDSLNSLPSLDLTLQTHTLDAEWEQELGDDNFRCIGINAMLQSNGNNFGTKRLPFVPNFSNYSAGLYAIQNFTLKKWDVEAGLRFDYRYYAVAGRDFSNLVYSSNMYFANASATFGATRKIGNAGKYTFGLSSTWRPPHVAELYSIGTHQSAAAIEYGFLIDEVTTRVRPIEEADFQNEKAVKWVNTYRLTTPKTQLELTAYANYIFNYIYLKPEGITRDVRGAYPYFRYRQTDASFIGVDLLVDQEITKSWSALFKTSLLKADDFKNDDYLIYVPSNRAEVLLRYDYKRTGTVNNIFASAGTSFVARQHRAPRVVSVAEILQANEDGIDLFANDKSMFDFIDTPVGYFLVQASMGFSINTGKQKIDFQLQCENLLNERYREYTNRMRYFSDEIGRNISLSLKYSF